MRKRFRNFQDLETGKVVKVYLPTAEKIMECGKHVGYAYPATLWREVRFERHKEVTEDQFDEWMQAERLRQQERDAS